MFRVLDIHNQAICLNCSTKTNAAYTKHGDLLICWKCSSRLSYESIYLIQLEGHDAGCIISVPHVEGVD